MTTTIKLVGQHTVEQYANNTYTAAKDWNKDNAAIMEQINDFLARETKAVAKLNKGFKVEPLKWEELHQNTLDAEYGRNGEKMEHYSFFKQNAKHILARINKTYGATEAKGLTNGNKASDASFLGHVVRSAAILVSMEIMEEQKRGNYNRARALHMLPLAEVVMYAINNKLEYRPQ